jgi:DNA-3-methyladenine glycosylase
MTEREFRPVTQEWLSAPTEILALELLNAVLVHETPRGMAAGRIVECEMYQGPQDRGAHSFGGVPTTRTQVMFGAPGYAYVYLIYGMYWCLNVVSGPPGVPHAILIRALEPLIGYPLMAERQKPGKVLPKPETVARGPGKLCRALDIGRAEYAHALWEPPLYLALPNEKWPPYEVARGQRINISYAGEAADYPWRFWIHNHPCVSRPTGRIARIDPAGGLP